MPVPRPLRERCREFLGIDGDIRYVFPATAFGGGAGFIFVVTDDQIAVISTGETSRSTPKSVWGSYPRGTRIGPVESGAGASFEFAGAVFEVDDEYVAVVNAADAEIFDRDSLPKDPLPDL
ncbi:hypothetical protein FHX41_1982 [Actinomadura hallensis]|uniref:PH (Pleckstrin Homology) domain-containing protein n=1 Tax=Actinomadura hallensis TaxID=337895 RepID=A0A543ICQ3_9ACTN|nr:hypothetical protein [Actinomadura hallensis]TQM68337.1 hypothetical protein FHX41_1982 [Actinomadura hallensis]HLV72172.1 hypothetical protein [Vulgatibacteraceae bacterium]